MEKIIFLILGQTSFAILIWLFFSLLSSPTLYKKRYIIATILAASGVVNLIMFIVCIAHEQWFNAIIFFLIALFWAWWFEKQSLTVLKNFIFVPYRRYKEEVIKLDGDTVELTAGPQMLPWPWFRLTMREDDAHDEETIPGFDSRNNTIELEDQEFDTGDYPPVKVTLQGIEAKLDFDTNYADEVNTFTSSKGDGQAGIIKVIISQIIDELGQFIGDQNIKDISNAKKLRDRLEANGAAQQVLDQVNRQIAQYGINSYKVAVLKAAKIKVPDSLIKAGEEKIKAEGENEAKEILLDGKITRAGKLKGVDIEDLDITEGNNRQGIKITGDKGGDVKPLINVQPATKK